MNQNKKIIKGKKGDNMNIESKSKTTPMAFFLSSVVSISVASSEKVVMIKMILISLSVVLLLVGAVLTFKKVKKEN